MANLVLNFLIGASWLVLSAIIVTYLPMRIGLAVPLIVASIFFLIYRWAQALFDYQDIRNGVFLDTSLAFWVNVGLLASIIIAILRCLQYGQRKLNDTDEGES